MLRQAGRPSSGSEIMPQDPSKLRTALRNNKAEHKIVVLLCCGTNHRHGGIQPKTTGSGPLVLVTNLGGWGCEN